MSADTVYVVYDSIKGTTMPKPPGLPFYYVFYVIVRSINNAALMQIRPGQDADCGLFEMYS